MIVYAGQGIYAAFAAAAGACAAQWTPPPTQKAVVQECHRGIRTSIRSINRDIARQKSHEAALKSQIKSLAAKNGTTAHRDVMAKAYELRLYQTQTTKLYNYTAQLGALATELRSMSAVLSRRNAIVDATGLMRVMNALNPPAETLHTMRQFAKQMQAAGLINESVDEMFADRDEESTEATEVEINALIRDIVVGRPAPERKPVVVEHLEGEDPEIPEDEEKDDPEPLQMERRLEALKA